MDRDRDATLARGLWWSRRVPKRALYAASAAARIAALLALFAFLGLRSGRQVSFGLFLIALGAAAAVKSWRRFFDWYKNPPLPADLASIEAALAEPSAGELFGLFDFNARDILERLRRERRFTRSGILRAIGESHLLDFFFARTGIRRADYLAALTPRFPEPPLGELAQSLLFRKTLRVAASAGHVFIRPVDLLVVLCDEVPDFARLLRNAGLRREDLDAIYRWEAHLIAERRRSRWLALGFRRGVGASWIYGYTPILDRFGRELAVNSALESLHVRAHDREIGEIANALSRTVEANAVVIGEPGTGAMTAMLGLAALLNEGRGPSHLNYKRVVKLEMDLLLGQPPGVLMPLASRIFREAEAAGNVILVIDEIHRYLGSGSAAPGFTEILVPYLKSSRVSIVGLTAPASYHRLLVETPAVASLFEKVEIVEPDAPTLVRILADYASHRERRFRVTVHYQALTAVAALAALYLPEKHFPEKGLELLEDVMIASNRGRGEGVVGSAAVEAFVRARLNVPVGSPGAKERSLLLDLERVIHERVVDQDDAIRAVADALRRARAGVASKEKPIGSFLFLGPTGVGKTETAKAVAAAYFGRRDAMIRLDMSEYQKPDALDRLIGSQDGRAVGEFATAVRESPFSLILLDEIEKAHPSIHHLFLQILDEGRATDVFGRKIDFRNAIIIATSNAGAEFIRQSLAAGVGYETLQQSLLEEVLRSGVFRPEFLNRFDAVVVFRPLGPAEVEAVANILLRELAARLHEENYLFELTPEFARWVAREGYSEAFGGRELKRFIQDRIESPLAKRILAGAYPKGTAIRLAPDELNAEPR